MGRLLAAYTGTSALAHTGQGSTWGGDGPYAQDYGYDVWGNITHRGGWGGVGRNENLSYTNNRQAGMAYDAAGNIVDGTWYTFSYDATGQQTRAACPGYVLDQAYDGDRLRGKKVDNGTTTYYLRSSVLGGQVVAELSNTGAWTRGYVYLGGQMVALQGGTGGAVSWVHQDPVTKSQRITNSSGNVISTVDLDPWGGDTSRSSNAAFQPHRYTSYERDVNGADDAMMRRYNRYWGRFDQPDPYDGSYDATNPQSFNRYAYVNNDPVNFVDPSGLDPQDPPVLRPYDPNGPYDPNLEQPIRSGGERGGGPGGVSTGPMEIELPSPTGEPTSGDGGPPNTDAARNPNDPCDSGQYASELQRDLSQIARTIGGTLDGDWNIHGPRRLTVDTATRRLADAGFVQFYSYNPDHPGVNLQGQLNGRWYHVTVSTFSSPNAAVNANRSSSGPNNATNSPSNRSSGRVNKVTAHCEKNKPDSAAHFWDYLMNLF